MNGLWKDTYNDIRNKTAAVFANATWHATKSLDVEAGARGSYDNRRDDGYQLLQNSQGEVEYGSGGGLNPVSVNGLAPVLLGGFATKATATAPKLTSPTLAASAFALTSPRCEHDHPGAAGECRGPAVLRHELCEPVRQPAGPALQRSGPDLQQHHPDDLLLAQLQVERQRDRVCLVPAW